MGVALAASVAPPVTALLDDAAGRKVASLLGIPVLGFIGLLLVAKRKDVAKSPVELEIRKTVDILTLEQSRLRGMLETSESTNHTINLVSQLDICARSMSLP